MSGQVHAVGSVVDFWFWPVQRPMSIEEAEQSGIGVASVVVKRSTWVVTTELRVVRLVHGCLVVDGLDLP